MADLKDDRKKEEEEYGGFEPDKNDDESFMLGEDNEYPAKLPDNFSDKPTPLEEVTASLDTKDDDTPDDDTANDNSDDITESDEIDEESIKEEEITSIPEYEEEIESPIEENIEVDEKVKEEAVETVEDESNEELDEDFKKKLITDIENSKNKREAEKENSEEESEPAKQIGDDADTVVMLNDIEADKPSTAGNKKIDGAVEKTSMFEEESESIDEAPAPEEIIEKKKKNKTPVWILMLYSSVATFIVTLGIVIIFWSLMVNDNNYATKKVQNNIQNKTAKNKPEEHSVNQEKLATIDSQSKEEQIWLDSMKSSDKDNFLTKKEEKNLITGLNNDVNEKHNATKEPNKIEHKKSEPKKAEPKNKPEDLASNDTKISTPKTKENNPNIDESQFSMPQPKGPVPENGIFTVQIYSSPSREDAESWLGQLKARQAPNAMITEQEIKGRTWYRVRYGKFETKDAARASALELGYSQSWIDRVK